MERFVSLAQFRAQAETKGLYLAVYKTAILVKKQAGPERHVSDETIQGIFPARSCEDMSRDELMKAISDGTVRIRKADEKLSWCIASFDESEYTVL